MRSAGVLMPVASLPSKYGIGCFSKEAYEFVNCLVKAGQSYWQILPLGPTGYGDSPYASFSTFAGNPYFIDPERLVEKGLLTGEELSDYDFGSDETKVDYEKLYHERFRMLKAAFGRTRSGMRVMPNEPLTVEDSSYSTLDSAYAGSSDILEAAEKAFTLTDGDLIPKKTNVDKNIEYREEYYKKDLDAEEEHLQSYIKDNDEWLSDYALYMAIKDSKGGEAWWKWEDSLRLRDKAALKEAERQNEAAVLFYKWVQYEFYEEWGELKQYANKKGIQIIGDIPIYVALDSADAWANPELFQFDGNNVPIAVSGCPPDYFSKDGQLWGNPLYRWDYHKKTHFEWWMKRLTAAFSFYDVVRIDHFRGFDAYYSIPYGAVNARHGKWEKGPGYAFFQELRASVGKKAVIAEDLGLLTDSVFKLVKRTGFPGMKVLQFAFDNGSASSYLPHNYPKNCLVYTGTHDNDTALGWCRTLSKRKRAFVEKYLRVKNTTDKELVWALIAAAYMSTADYCIIPMQDILCLGTKCRTNTPSTLGKNWQWRMKPQAFTDGLCRRLKTLAGLYGRI